MLCIYIIVMCIVSNFIIYLVKCAKEYREQKIKERIKILADNSIQLSTDEFWNFKKVNKEFSGVYVIYNKNKGIYYIGQAKQILYRVNKHFLGRGNGDVYSDYKYGDEFTIKLLDLDTSGYDSLNELEKDTILTFDSFNNGYNKTRGNVDGGRFSLFHPYGNVSYKSKYNKRQILALVKKCAQGTLEEQFEVYSEIRRGLFGVNLEFPGIYIIHNKTKKLYYVSKFNKNIFDAINKQFTGKGNNDIYADYKHGNDITIKTMSSGYNKYSTIEELIEAKKIEYSKIADDYVKIKKRNNSLSR